MERLFSGIQPSGNIHIGNYLGALRHWVALQQRYNCIFCIVDLHAVTTIREPLKIRQMTRECAAILIAAGIDNEQSILFVQSHIPAHSQLTWILNCITPFGRLRRMTQFKEKGFLKDKQVTAGLFDYPVLMAADILLYQTDIVPVGDDQRQHIEFTRDTAERFNAIYGETFKLPIPLIPQTGARIMGLDDPSNKMSKSQKGKGHAVYLRDTPDEIRFKILGAKTDALREIRWDPNRAGIHNLLVIYQAFSGLSREAAENRFEGLGYQELKTELADMIIEHLRPIRERFTCLMEDPHHIDVLLKKGAERARPAAEMTITDIHQKIGLG